MREEREEAEKRALEVKEKCEKKSSLGLQKN